MDDEYVFARVPIDYGHVIALIQACISKPVG
jgi:hypothetical protein